MITFSSGWSGLTDSDLANISVAVSISPFSLPQHQPDRVHLRHRTPPHEANEGLRLAGSNVDHGIQAGA